jgi:hypothetical protein
MFFFLLPGVFGLEVLIESEGFVFGERFGTTAPQDGAFGGAERKQVPFELLTSFTFLPGRLSCMWGTGGLVSLAISPPTVRSLYYFHFNPITI